MDIEKAQILELLLLQCKCELVKIFPDTTRELIYLARNLHGFLKTFCPELTLV
jgi:hypothetical protein